MAEERTQERTREIFVSCSGQDREVAAELVGELEKLGRTAFIFTRDIPAAAEWERTLVEALQGARLVAVLLSSHTLKAHYQGEEIRIAIGIHRREGSSLLLAPVLLERVTDPRVGFGLSGFQQIDLSALGVAATARQLAELLGPDQPGPGDPESGEPGSEPPHTVGDVFHRAALKIDRSDQWAPILANAASETSAVFLLHGPKQQNLDLFSARLQLYLPAESQRHLRFCPVPLAVNGIRPRTGAGWETHLVHALSRQGRRSGRAVDLLREAARKQSLFLIVNRLPIGAGDLDEAQQEGLEEFLSQNLPRLIVEASKGVHPIRALFATHYDTEADSLTERLDEKALGGCNAVGLRYQRLPAVKALQWSDVESYLFSRPKRPPKRVFRRLEECFDRLAENDLQFRDVIELLERELGDEPNE